ncbi:MAG: HEAT repeat domain-containing protein [Anaerolineae bacterium]
MTSPAWEKFLKSNFFGSSYYAWHDGVDVQVLQDLSADEKHEAERIFLKTPTDKRYIEGLAALKSQQALPVLIPLLKHTYPEVRISAARAIRDISGADSGLDALVGVLNDTKIYWGTRMDAARYLNDFRSKRAVDALVKALDDGEQLVRYHAANSLATIYRIPSNAGEIMRVMTANDAIAALKAKIADLPIPTD